MSTGGGLIRTYALFKRADAEHADDRLKLGWWVAGVTSSDLGGGVYVTLVHPDYGRNRDSGRHDG